MCSRYIFFKARIISATNSYINETKWKHWHQQKLAYLCTLLWAINGYVLKQNKKKLWIFASTFGDTNMADVTSCVRLLFAHKSKLGSAVSSRLSKPIIHEKKNTQLWLANTGYSSHVTWMQITNAQFQVCGLITFELLIVSCKSLNLANVIYFS